MRLALFVSLSLAWFEKPACPVQRRAALEGHSYLHDYVSEFPADGPDRVWFSQLVDRTSMMHTGLLHIIVNDSSPFYFESPMQHGLGVFESFIKSHPHEDHFSAVVLRLMLNSCYGLSLDRAKDLRPKRLKLLALPTKLCREEGTRAAVSSSVNRHQLKQNVTMSDHVHKTCNRTGFSLAPVTPRLLRSDESDDSAEILLLVGRKEMKNSSPDSTTGSAE